MQAPNKRRKRRGKLYFSSTKALKTSRMGRKKMAIERNDTSGINKVLDFEDTVDNATLSTVDESEPPLTSQGRGYRSREVSKELGTQSTPASNPATAEHCAEDEVEETSLMEPEGGYLKPGLDVCIRLRVGARVLEQLCH
jgi:hypothetical protein